MMGRTILRMLKSILKIVFENFVDIVEKPIPMHSPKWSCSKNEIYIKAY